MVISDTVAIYSLPPVSWKNGGGLTRTLVVEPEGAGLDDFLWRISVAEIQASGSFSAFPGVDRTILLWSGEGVILRSPAWPEHALTQLWQPFSFRGEEDVFCELLGGPTEDLNLMVRRGAVSAAIHAERREVRLVPPYDDVVVLCAAERVHVVLSDRPKLALDAGQLLRISQLDAEVTLLPEGSGASFVCVTVKLLL
jgi:environmental stress-induced protein Ves